MQREEIISQIDEERRRQDEKWGGEEHDKIHSINSWISILGTLLHNLLIGGVDPRKQFIKIGAVVFAALENEESWG